MTKEEVAEEIKACEERLKYLREELNKPEYDDKRPKLKMGEGFFYIGNSGYIFEGIWTDSEICRNVYALGNVFPTQEAAEFELERRKVIAELSDYAEGDDAVWDSITKHWYVWWDGDEKAITVTYGLNANFPGVSFPSEEAAKAAIEAVGEDRVKKYYLKVKEGANNG